MRRTLARTLPLSSDARAPAAARVTAAAALRRRLRLPSPGETDTYRLINREGDRLSGLVADVFGDFAVVASTAAWLEARRATVAAALLEATGCKALLWRPSPDLLRLEGVSECGPPVVITPDGAVAPLAKAGDSDEPDDGVPRAADAIPERVQVVESGVRYHVALRTGQKTGFYCDQRESRGRVRHAAAGARVLDVCCYSGGFAINAALGGAAHVTGVDSSAAVRFNNAQHACIAARA